jgi:hypothetical protein
MLLGFMAAVSFHPPGQSQAYGLIPSVVYGKKAPYRLKSDMIFAFSGTNTSECDDNWDLRAFGGTISSVRRMLSYILAHDYLRLYKNNDGVCRSFLEYVFMNKWTDTNLIPLMEIDHQHIIFNMTKANEVISQQYMRPSCLTSSNVAKISPEQGNISNISDICNKVLLRY